MRVAFGFICVLLFVGICFAREEKPLDLGKPVVIVNEKTFVPLSEMAEWMKVKIFENNGKLSIACGKKTVELSEKESFLVRALRLETYIDKKGKRRERVISVPYTMVSLRFLADNFGYRINCQSNSITIEGMGKRAIITPKPYIDLHFSGFRGTGTYGDFSFPISGGRKKYPVPEGWFWVYTKDRDHKSSQWPRPYGGAKMPYALFFSNGSAIHVGSLNAPSHSCVHVRKKDARKLFEQVDLYTLVLVRKTGKGA
jgi:hypothetical protein